MDKIGQPRKQDDRSSPLKEGKPPKAKRKVYTYTCSLCTLEVQSDHQRSLDDKHGAAAEMHGHHIFLLLCAAGQVRNLNAAGPICRACERTFRLRPSDYLLTTMRAIFLSVRPSAGGFSFFGPMNYRTAARTATFLKSVAADARETASSASLDSILLQHLRVVAARVSIHGFAIVPAPVGSTVVLAGPPPAVRRFTGCVPRPQPPLLFLVFALTHPLSPLLASFWVLQARTKRRCRP